MEGNICKQSDKGLISKICKKFTKQKKQKIWF